MIILIYFCAFLLTTQGKPLENQEKSCGYSACPKYHPDALNVHLIPHSHDDVGWLKTVDQYYFQDVQNLLNAVIPALKQNPDRRFIQVETAFFKRWWEQTPHLRQDVIDLINRGQLEIAGGGWSMSDEGAVHYQSTIDQFTLGLRYLKDKLGDCGRPRTSWQIDTFGHSREHASISAHLGFDSVFFARFDYRDKEARKRDKTTDMLWRGSNNLGNTSDILASIVHNHYGFPSGFCFDIECTDAPIIDDEESPDFNYQQRVEEFAKYARSQADVYPTNNILVTMGDDFRYQSALQDYINIDRLIKGFDLYPQEYNGMPIRLYYSTPSCYAKAVNDYVTANNYELTIKTDDFLPFASDKNNYWNGYFTSRAASKRYERFSNNLVQVTKQLGVAAKIPYDNANITALKEVIGVMQHHDAITGTERQHVANNYNLLITNAIKKADYTASSIISMLVSNNKAEFSSCVLANVSYCPQTKDDQFTVAVYNPLAQSFSQPISIPVESTDWEIVDSDGNPVKYQVDPTIRDFSYLENMTPSPFTLEFIAENLPPVGVKTYKFTKQATKSKSKIQTDHKKPIKIGYEGTSFEINEKGLLSSITMNGITIDVQQELLYYKTKEGSGSYIFNTFDDELKKIATDTVNTTIILGDVYTGVLQKFNTWAQQMIKVYKHDQSYIVIDWIIGPMNNTDGFGKEAVTKFVTNLKTNERFFTDSNGREMIERRRNYRPTYNYTDEHHVPGNYFPINNKVVLRDEEAGVEFAVLTDRSEGGSSLVDGELEIMIHRVCVQDDFGDKLNEQEYGQGIVIRGQHHLVVGPISGNGQKSLAAIERQLAIRKHVAPWTFFTTDDINPGKSISLVNNELPENVHILTLESWGENKVLLRLEHILEKDDDEELSKSVTVDLSNLFSIFKIVNLEELALGGNILLEEMDRLHWPGSNNDLPSNYKKRENMAELSITLGPMEIRTFLLTVDYVD